MDASARCSAEIGMQIRRARVAGGISLTRLAERAGIGKGSLSELESGQRNPTLSTLYAIANALDLPLSHLLADRSGTELSSPGITARLLETLPQPDGGTVEVYLLDLGEHLHVSDAHRTGVVEHLYLVAGRAAAGPVDAPVEIAANESTTWTADTPHSYRSLTDRATGILTITTPH